MAWKKNISLETVIQRYVDNGKTLYSICARTLAYDDSMSGSRADLTCAKGKVLYDGNMTLDQLIAALDTELDKHLPGA